MSSIMKLSRTLIKNLSKRSFAQNQYAGSGRKKSMLFALRKLVFNSSGFNKYGLYSNDVIAYDDPVVCEALRRLPTDVLDARNFRLIRAMQLDFLKTQLPRDKWITYEEDLQYRYLSPYIKEVEAERAEIYEFGCLNYKDSDWPANEVK